ncbi:hypothetical protein KJA16_00185 [Patescibacteria group bacterium]|nr:hypothetical protein [Patescibacteria group bacterium]
MTEKKMKDGRRAITKEEAIKNFKFLPKGLKRRILASPELTEAEKAELRFGY